MQLARGQSDLFEHRYEHSFLRILRHNELSEASYISRFQAEELCCPVFHQRLIEGFSLTRIAAKFSNLATIGWAVNDDRNRYPALRQQHRFGNLLVYVPLVPRANV